jgi:hypothetical protein
MNSQLSMTPVSTVGQKIHAHMMRKNEKTRFAERPNGSSRCGGEIRENEIA